MSYSFTVLAVIGDHLLVSLHFLNLVRSFEAVCIHRLIISLCQSPPLLFRKRESSWEYVKIDEEEGNSRMYRVTV